MALQFIRNFFASGRKFIKHEGGALGIVMALSFPMLIGCAGIAIDLASAYNAKTRLGNALDKAALAAASMGGTDAEIRDRMIAFFNANYPSDRIGTPHDVELEVVGSKMVVTAHSRVATKFMKYFGRDYLDIGGESQVLRQMGYTETVLVLDVTGSMEGPNIQGLKTASTNFINIMFDQVSNPAHIKMGIVPWGPTVNVGNYGLGLNPDGSSYGQPFIDRPATDLYVSPASSINYGTGPFEWAGCVVESQPGTPFTTDEPPAPNWGMYRYPAATCVQRECVERGCVEYHCAQRECLAYQCAQYEDEGGDEEGGCKDEDGGTKNDEEADQDDGKDGGGKGGGGKDGDDKGDGKGLSVLGGDNGGGKDGEIGEIKEIDDGKDDCDIKGGVQNRGNGAGNGPGGGSGACIRYSDVCISYSGTCERYDPVCTPENETCVRYGDCIEWSGNPNNYCPRSTVVPLTSNRSRLLTTINNLQTAGNTYSDVGMRWGWKVLSPEEPFTEGVSYNNAEWKKIVVLMTDGDNTVNHIYSGEGPAGAPGVSATTSDQNNKFSQICTNMKEKGIQIYTVTFQSDINAATKAVYRDCASSPSMYFDAPSNDDLVEVFRKIAHQISKLRLLK